MLAIKQIIENIIIAFLFLIFILFSSFGLKIISDKNQRVDSENNKNNIASVANLDSENNINDNNALVFPLARIIKVIDGDTVKVITGDSIVYTVRMIGINTPETVDPRREVQCYGREASDKAKESLIDRKVRLDLDPTQQKFDKYNRLLAHVYIIDDISNTKELFYNKYMIENGFAYEYTYGTPYVFQKEFKEAEKNARESKIGLWGERGAGGSGCN